MELDIRSAKRLAYTYQAFVDYKIDQSLLGRFIDNQDFKRFLAASTNRTALRQVTFTTQLFVRPGLCDQSLSTYILLVEAAGSVVLLQFHPKVRCKFSHATHS